MKCAPKNFIVNSLHYLKLEENYLGYPNFVFQNMVTLRGLVGIAGLGGMVTGLTGLTLHTILQKRVRDSPVYQEAMEKINKHPAVISLLGEPIKSDRIDVGNKNNVLSLRLSTLEVPVYGPKNKGVLYIWADRLTDSDKWNIYRLELKILDSAGGKLRLLNKQPAIAEV